MDRLDKVEEDLAGYGKRLNTISDIQGRHDERIKSNKSNITDLWLIVNSIRTEIKSAVRWIIGIVSIPTILVLYQLISNAQKVAAP